ncbi:hypothetical protein PILCRDRAFT_1992 [Piloderma croceum F 1598]|uniref:Uncharacterized protein n=1 Tax=Piloderma croceum (strain F 1598) TaxID=765440 RepID=A0A0C3GD90_PILCF|nr:hypothetical protein PILCRDRAFT_1992 [Piloderma croceum F 1598]
MDLNGSLHDFFLDYEIDQWLNTQGQGDGAALEQAMAALSNHLDFADWFDLLGFNVDPNVANRAIPGTSSGNEAPTSPSAPGSTSSQPVSGSTSLQPSATFLNSYYGSSTTLNLNISAALSMGIPSTSVTNFPISSLPSTVTDLTFDTVNPVWAHLLHPTFDMAITIALQDHSLGWLPD